ncbi:MAG TPA: CDP-alcohol phosphatidyltransferase family protein, partial [bacterium]|nr:CDP-alcohol phosphatidyltransferase family protein [bacterium]
IWITLGPLFVINAVLVSSFFMYHIWFSKKKKREFAGAKNQGSSFLDSTTREWWFWTTDPIVRFLIKLRISPNMITIMGLFIAAISGLLFAIGSFGYAGWAMVFGASFDFFDGRVARITGKCTRSGAFFDSVTDRVGEAACFLGIAYYFRDGWIMPIAIIAMIASTMVSYTRARGEALGIDCAVGVMQRPERIVYMGVAAIMQPVADVILEHWWHNPAPVLVIGSTIFIAAMTIWTSAYRTIFVMNALDTQDKRGKETMVQILSKLTTHSGREELWEKARYGYDRSKARFAHVVIFNIGGVDRKIFDSMLTSGELPNLSGHISSRGGKYELCGSFPSTAGTAIAPYITGCFPGTCDIPGIRWFDRSISSSKVFSMNRFRDYDGWGTYAMDHDLSNSVRTIFEYSRQAANIFGPLNRGCGLVRDMSFFSTLSRFQKARSAADLDAAANAALGWFSSAARKETDFVFYSFPPAAFLNPEEASEEAVKYSYRRLDEYIGGAIGILKDRGLYDRTALFFVPDCSLVERKKRFDLKNFLSKRGKVAGSSGNLKDWQESDVISLPSGTSMANLYFKKGGSWDERNFFEDIERKGIVGSLIEKAEIDIVAGRSNEGGIIVQSSRGKARIIEDADGRITYLTREDPFGYVGQGQVLDASSGLERSWESAYPDAIVQLLGLFRSKRAGDIVTSAASGVSLLSTSHDGAGKYTHGSLLSEHIIVPLLSSVVLREGPMRSTDIFSTVLDIFGIAGAHALDGVPLTEFSAKVEEGACAG